MGLLFFNMFCFVLFFYWMMIDLENFAVFCQTSTWISHKYTYIPSLLKLPPISLPVFNWILTFNRFGGSGGIQDDLLIAFMDNEKDRHGAGKPLFDWIVLSHHFWGQRKFIMFVSSAFFASSAWSNWFSGQFPFCLETPVLDVVPRFHVGNCWWFSPQFPISLNSFPKFHIWKCGSHCSSPFVWNQAAIFT